MTCPSVRYQFAFPHGTCELPCGAEYPPIVDTWWFSDVSIPAAFRWHKVVITPVGGVNTLREPMFTNNKSNKGFLDVDSLDFCMAVICV
jgi:hypothetical protein